MAEPRHGDPFAICDIRVNNKRSPVFGTYIYTLPYVYLAKSQALSVGMIKITIRKSKRVMPYTTTSTEDRDWPIDYLETSLFFFYFFSIFSS